MPLGRDVAILWIYSTMGMYTLRSNLIRLAHIHPEFRQVLLPLLKKSAASSFGTTYVTTLAETVKRKTRLQYHHNDGFPQDEVALGKPEDVIKDFDELEETDAKIPLLMFYAEGGTPQVGVFMYPDRGPEVWPAPYQDLSGDFERDMRICIGLVQAHLK